MRLGYSQARLHSGLLLHSWYARRELNPHDRSRWNLTPVRLPVSPLAHVMVGEAGFEPAQTEVNSFTDCRSSPSLPLSHVGARGGI